jgi:hypothetical protein
MLIRSGKRLLRNVPPMPCRVRQVRQCFYEHRRRYGSRRIAKQLKLGRFRVRSLMKRENLRAKSSKEFCAAHERIHGTADAFRRIC